MTNKVKLEISGKNPDYFLKEIIRRNINVYKVEKNHHSLKLIINYNDLETIMSIKTSYKLKILERYGLNKYKYLIRKYFIFILFIIFGILLNIIMSNMIFDIEVIHSNKNVIKTIKKDLQELGLKKYHFKVSYEKKEAIKEKLLSKEKNLLEWIEIEEKGTHYIVKVEQRKKNTDDNICNFRHIIAKKNALIKEIHASSGEIVKKKNDYVTKGDVVISGLIHNKEEVVQKRCSIGKVYGEVWYTASVQVPKITKKEFLTEDKKIGLSLKFIKKEYEIFNNYQTYEKNEYNIIKSKVIPIKIALAKYTKTKIKESKISSEQASEIALNAATKKIASQIKKDEEIISKKVLKIEENNSKIKVEIFFKVKEDITSYLDITDLNIDELNKKEE